MPVTFTTQRLLLRLFEEKDVPAVIKITTSPKVSGYMQDMIYGTPESAQGWISMLDRLYDEKAPFVVLAIVPRETGEPVGYVGLHPKEELHNEVEVLYAVMDAYQGRGYAAEAGQALAGWCFMNTGTPFIAAIVKPDNIASAKVVQKLGFELKGSRTIPYNGQDSLFHYYRLNRAK